MLLMARLEFRTRLRTGRWKILFGAWFLVLALFSVLLRVTMDFEDPGDDGIAMFGTLLFFVLLLMLLISPALTAQSINGDRERGTLAPLQLTRLTPLEIASGKLLAAWSTGLAVLAVALPFLAWPILEGEVSPVRGIVCVLVTALLIGVVCAVSQALSALVARGVTSGLLAYLTVFGLMCGTVIVYVLVSPLFTVSRYDADSFTYRGEETDTRYTWWILAPNPFVVLADAAPGLPRELVCPEHSPPGGGGQGCYYVSNTNADILGDLGRTVRETRVGAQKPNEPYPEYERRQNAAPAVWPYGLGANLLLAAGSLTITTRRLRIPVERLPKGVRVA